MTVTYDVTTNACIGGFVTVNEEISLVIKNQT